MLHVLTALLLIATTATPTARAIPKAEVVIHIPRVDRLGPVVKFLSAAGRHSALLRPDTWARELLPGLAVDLRDTAGLQARGIDVTRPLTSSFFGAGKVTCFSLRDPAAFDKAARAALEQYGPLWKDKAPGVFGVHVEGNLVYGVTIKKKDACVADDAEGVKPRLDQAHRVLAKAPAAVAPFAGLTGDAYVLVPGRVAVALSAEGDTLQASGASLVAAEPRLQGAGPSPYGALQPSGVLTAKTRLHEGSTRFVARRLDSQLAAACPTCDRQRSGELVFTLSQLLTGDAALRVDRIQVVGSLRSPAARFFAVKQALVARVTEPASAKRLLDGLKAWPNARPTDRGYALTMDGGEIELGLSGNNLFFGNDAQAVTTLLQELPPTAAPLAHGAVVDVDPKLVHKAFGQVSLLDLMSSRELAAIVAVGTELGPLFGHTRAITAWADPGAGGKHRFTLQWTLDAGAGGNPAP